MNLSPELIESRFQDACADLSRLQSVLEKTIVGQHRLIRGMIAAVFADGHVLLEGLPGLGKTHLAKALAATLGVDLARVQCTPDLMPTDITGSEILLSGESGDRQLAFRKGPIFSSMVLVDEINRATPKTQAALLEAMQEAQVTHAGIRHPLPRPFWVLATQNPIEIEGTYPLPEAQLDRFLVKIDVRYPDADALLQLVEVSLDDEPSDHLETILAPRRVREIIALAKEVVIAGSLKRAAVELVLATQPESAAASGKQAPSRHFRYGASPRGLQALLRVARVLAILDDRAHVSVEDLAEAALPVMRHRVLLRVESELEGVVADDVLGEILKAWLSRRD